MWFFVYLIPGRIVSAECALHGEKASSQLELADSGTVIGSMITLTHCTRKKETGINRPP